MAAFFCFLLAMADTRPLIVAFGDSITEGYGVRNGESYPDQLQSALDQKGMKWRVVNAGVSGDTTGNALDRMAQVIALRPRAVILEIGGNDGLRGLPVTQSRRNLEELVGGLRKSGVRVLLVGMTLPRNYGPAYVAQFEQMYDEIAKKHRVPLAPVKSAKIAGGPGLMQPDGIHPTGAGYRKLVEFLLPYVEKLLR